MTGPISPDDDQERRPPDHRPDEESAPDPLWDLERAARQALADASGLAKSLGLDEASRTALDVVRTAAEAAWVTGGIAGRALPPEARQALADLDRALRAVQRDAVDPTIGAARLLAQSLDSLGVLVAEPIAALPEPLASLVALAARLARDPVTVALTLPSSFRQARLAATVVRDLVDHAETAEPPASLDRLERAIEEAVLGAVFRNQASAPLAHVRVTATVRHDLLSIDIADGATDDGGWLGAGARSDDWDIHLVRREMDVVAFTASDSGGILRLERRLTLR